MARREQQKLDRERRILGAATRLFESKGYADTAMEDVAAGAGLAVGTLYNYFRSKPDLLLAILGRETEELLAAGRRVVDAPPDDPADAVSALIDTYLRVFAHHEKQLWRDLVAAAVAEPLAMGRATFEADLRLLGQLVELLERLQASGVLGAHVEVGRAAIALFSIYFTWFSVFLVTEGVTVEIVSAEIRRGIEIAMRGLLPGGSDAVSRQGG
jgi:AcrR family transcriptional regulator